MVSVEKDAELYVNLLCINNCIYIGKSAPNRKKAPLKSSSSLDGSFGIGPMSINLKRPQSPYSSNSDISQFLSSTYGHEIFETNRSNTGLTEILNKNKDLNKVSPGQSSNKDIENKLNFACEIKNLQQKIMEELKTTDSTSANLAMFDRLKNHSGFTYSTELIPDKLGHNMALSSTLSKFNPYESYAKYPKTSSFYTVGEPISDRNGFDRYSVARQRNLSETRLGNIMKYGIKNKLPFKSFEYESLNPVRYSDNKYRLMRPMSSISFYENDLRESVIPNYMNTNNGLENLLLNSHLVGV